MCLYVLSLSLSLFLSLLPSLAPSSLSLSPLSLSSPGAMIKVAGMSLCSTAVITEERRASEGGKRREGRGGEEREKGVERSGSPIQAAPHCPPLAWRYTMMLSHQRFELDDLAKVYGT